MRNGLTIKRLIAAIVIVLLISIIKNWKDVKRGFIDGYNDGHKQFMQSK